MLETGPIIRMGLVIGMVEFITCGCLDTGDGITGTDTGCTDITG
jgi:hypothetical protein